MINLQSPGPAAKLGVPATVQCSLPLTFLGPLGQSHPQSDLSSLQRAFRNRSGTCSQNCKVRSLRKTPELWLNCVENIITSGCSGAACRILVPRPGIEPVPPALEVWSLNHWTAREVPGPASYKAGVSGPGGGKTALNLIPASPRRQIADLAKALSKFLPGICTGPTKMPCNKNYDS